MLNDSLQIKGQSLVLNDQQGRSRKGKPRKLKRQLFNRDFFKNEETHEIANHYKDYQRKRRKIRKKRRKSSVKFSKTFEERINYREVLQIPCFIYPRFSEVFPWRGRQTICEQQPPDTIYNSTIRRITFADTLNELHTLATRQTFLYRNTLNQQQVQNTINIKRGQPTIRSLTTNPISTTFLQFTKNIQELEPQREKLKPKLGCVRREVILSTIKPYKNNTKVTKVYNDDELIQLASEWYDEGFQSHWDYLKSIGERNALKRGRKHSTCSATSSCRSLSVLSSSSNSGEFSGKSISSLKRIVHIKRPSIKRTRRIYIRNDDDDDLYPHSECQIRIDITRSPSADSRIDKSEQLSDYNNKNHKNFQDPCDSMSDFLFNDNLLASNKSPSVNGGSNFNPIKNRNVTELIDSLCGLQISDTGSLPKIILTDFSSSHDTTAGPSTTISSGQSSSTGCCYKQQNFNYQELDSSLGIPDEKNYRSEARPP